MKKLFIKILTVLALSAIMISAVGCSFVDKPGNSSDNPQEEKLNYYFDSAAPGGGDGSKEKPFNDLTAFSSLSLKGGEKAGLKAGSVFTGGLVLENIKGTETEHIAITSYGDTKKLGKPKINGNGLTGTGVVYIKNCEYLTVENLEVYDDAKEEGDRRGVLIEATNPSGKKEVVTYREITLKNLYIHDIYGYTDSENSGMSAESKKTGGIHVWTSDGYGRFDGLYIDGNKIENVDNAGIATWYKPGTGGNSKISPYSSDFAKYAFLNVYIENNDISYIGKNAVFARNLWGGKISGNTMYETAIKCVSGNTICTSYVFGTVVEYNEGYYNRAKAKADGTLQDGCMLDADLQSRDTIWQYNYSHDNAFGLFLNCTSYDSSRDVGDKVIVRYNLSVHDEGKKGVVYINYPAKNVEMYNNTFVLSAQTSPIILKSNQNRNFSFYNNIIYNLSPNAKFEIATSSGATINNNLVYSSGGGKISNLDAFKTLNANGVYVNPVFKESYSDDDGRIGRDLAKNFLLTESSPAFGSAAVSASVSDFFGNPYDNAIGFACGK